MFARQVGSAASTVTKSVVKRNTTARPFHVSALLRVAVGDKIPDVELVESSPGNKVSIAKELQGKGLIIGVPAAFSMYEFLLVFLNPSRRG